MANEVTIASTPRDTVGKNESRRLRRQGLIPCVVYGGGREPEGVAVDPRPLETVLASERSKNTLIHLRIGDRELKRMVLIREIQRHPVTDRLMHADFVRVEMDRKTDVAIPIVAIGIPAGVKNEGGMLQYVHRELPIRVLPAEIPEHVEIDVSELHVGQHVSAGQLRLPEGAELLMPPAEAVITVVGKKAEEAAAETPAEGEAAPTEPATTPTKKSE